jgi:hypothetical protein
MRNYTDQPNAVDYEVRVHDGDLTWSEVICQTFNEAKHEARIAERKGYTDIEIIAADPDESVAWWTYKNGKTTRTE